MSVLQDLNLCLIQGEHVDELTPVIVIVHPLHSVWVALSTAECVAMLFVDTGLYYSIANNQY